jgi:hypothetical protein
VSLIFKAWPVSTKAWYGLAACILVVLKFLLVSDLAPEIIFAPTDDALYAYRASVLLQGQALGPYDGRTLVKLPGFSLWLAGIRQLGLPYLFTLNALFTVAVFYFAATLKASGLGRGVVLLTLAAMLFNPITLGAEWL